MSLVRSDWHWRRAVLAIARPVPRTVSRTPSSWSWRYAGDGVRVDREFAGQFADAGDEIAAADGAVGDGEFDLPHDLVVDGEPVSDVNMQEHRGLSRRTVLPY